MIRAIDLCCGAGGWAVAARGLPIEWVAVADIAADCLETWRQNHADEHPKYNLLRVDLSTPEGIDTVKNHVGRKRIDLIVGGIPCEQVSCARSRNQADAEEMASWHALIDGCLGLVRHFTPRFWCFEDVIQIEKHLPGPLQLLMSYRVLRIEAIDHGPQDRQRTFFGDFPRVVAPAAKPSLRDCLLPGPHLSEPNPDDFEQLAPKGRNSARIGRDRMRVLTMDGHCPTVMGHFSCGGRQRRSFMIRDDSGRVRRLSWQEAARIQGFPDDYLFAAGYMRVEKMVGQAIPIQVGRAILKGVVEAHGAGRHSAKGANACAI